MRKYIHNLLIMLSCKCYVSISISFCVICMCVWDACTCGHICGSVYVCKGKYACVCTYVEA